MKRGGRIELCALVGILLSTGAQAVTSDQGTQPYQGIVDRNVFNLHPPPPPINPADAINHQPPAKVTFTGITTILGRKLAFLTIPPTKPGALPESMMLAEGQAQDDVEVKEIDDKAGVVKIVNHGDPQTLDFEHDGVKTPGGPPGPNPMALPRPSLPPPNVMSAPQNVIRPLRSLPGRGTPFSDQPPPSPEEQVVLFEAQRAKAQQENDPTAALFPPTVISEEANGQQQPQ